MIEPRPALHRLLSGGDLSRDEIRALFGRIMDGTVDDVLKAGLLVALAMKGESADELAGAAEAMRERVVGVPHHREDVVDTCGTGGDAKGTFNISTAAALVAAAAGAPIAKHGNRSVSSKSGSADVLEALGVPIETDPEHAGAALDAVGIAFLFAPRHHPAMREVMPVRRDLGVRTAFNLLGPLTNPAGARRQLLGVYADDKVELVAGVLARLGTDHALVVHGADGLDEITLTGPTRVAEVRGDEVRVFTVEPADSGLEPCAPEELAGGDPEENAAAMERVLSGEDRGPLARITALNAGAALYVAGLTPDVPAGVEAARDTLARGAAAAKLDELRTFRPGDSRSP